MPLQLDDDGCENEGQKDAEREGNEDFTPEIKDRRHSQDQDRYRQRGEQRQRAPKHLRGNDIQGSILWSRETDRSVNLAECWKRNEVPCPVQISSRTQ